MKIGLNQKRLDKFVRVTDDWYPCFENNTIKVSILLSYMPENKYWFVRIMAWGNDDFGLIMDYENENYDLLLEKYDEFKMEFFDKATDGINKEWFYKRGFEQF